MKYPLWRRIPANFVAVILLMALAAFFSFACLDTPLLEPEEARYAEIPRQMLERGDFGIPTLDGQAYLDKPPLLYWLVMGSYWLFGVHDWAARLIPATSCWLTIAVVYLWARKSTGTRGALVCALTLMLSADFIYRGRMLTMNPLLALAVAAGLAAGQLAVNSARFRWWAATGLACGLGVLIKGPVALVLVVGPIIFLQFRLARQGNKRMRASFMPAVKQLATLTCIAMLVSAPWFIWVAIKYTGFIEYFFWKHHVVRFAAPFDHAKPFWFFLPQVLLGAFPWTLLLVPLIIRPRRLWQLVQLQNSTCLYCLFAAVWGLLFFSFSGSKRPAYLLPVYPALALVLGRLLEEVCFAAENRSMDFELDRRKRNASRIGWGITGTVVAAGLGVAILFFLPRYADDFSLAKYARQENARQSSSSLPVCCYPHGWDSLRFYLGRSDVQVFLPSQSSSLLATLDANPETLFFAKTGHELDALLREIPADLTFEIHQQDRWITAGVVKQVARPVSTGP